MKSTDEESLHRLVSYDGDLQLRDSPLWFDAVESRGLCFISHASVPGARHHQRTIATEATAELMQAFAPRGRARGVRQSPAGHALTAPYGQRFSLGTLDLELIPSGYALGAASLVAQWRGHTVLYAGPINPRPIPLADPLEARRCDLLVLPCSPSMIGRLVLPPVDEVERALLKFVQRTLGDDETPVLLCSPVGVAQQLIALLGTHGMSVRMHPEILAACRVYAEHGLEPLAGMRLRRFDKASLEQGRHVVLWPIDKRRSRAIANLAGARLAAVSPGVLDTDARARLDCEAAFALGDQADHGALIDYVRACSAQCVVMLGTTGECALADDLQALGLSVQLLGPQRQLELFGCYTGRGT